MRRSGRAASGSGQPCVPPPGTQRQDAGSYKTHTAVGWYYVEFEFRVTHPLESDGWNSEGRAIRGDQGHSMLVYAHRIAIRGDRGHRVGLQFMWWGPAPCHSCREVSDRKSEDSTVRPSLFCWLLYTIWTTSREFAGSRSPASGGSSNVAGALKSPGRRDQCHSRSASPRIPGQRVSPSHRKFPSAMSTVRSVTVPFSPSAATTVVRGSSRSPTMNTAIDRAIFPADQTQACDEQAAVKPGMPWLTRGSRTRGRAAAPVGSNLP